MMKGDDEDLGEKKWELAQKQMSSRDLIEANSSLSEAEKLFSLSGNKKRSFDVFVEESKLHLCLGLVNEATKEIEKAMELMKEIPQMEEDMGVIFQSGLVHLCKGSENEAHHDLTKYIELAEITGDIEAQARGHFYLALIYDGHNEPCMATAELELGRDISKDLEHKKYYTASTAYLAHLWIAKGEMKIAEPMVDESLRLVERIEEGSSLALGMAMLMSAERSVHHRPIKREARTRSLVLSKRSIDHIRPTILRPLLIRAMEDLAEEQQGRAGVSFAYTSTFKVRTIVQRIAGQQGREHNERE